MMCHKMGLPPTSTIGFGRSVVSSDRRVPSPPARITAFISGAVQNKRVISRHRWDYLYFQLLLLSVFRMRRLNPLTLYHKSLTVHHLPLAIDATVTSTYPVVFQLLEKKTNNSSRIV